MKPFLQNLDLDEIDRIRKNATKIPYLPFPIKLFQLLRDVEEQGCENIISWIPDSEHEFCVYDRKQFVQQILGKYFRAASWRSFNQQLNNYGFEKGLSRSSGGTFRHATFRRNDYESAKQVVRIKSVAAGAPKRVIPISIPTLLREMPKFARIGQRGQAEMNGQHTPPKMEQAKQDEHENNQLVKKELSHKLISSDAAVSSSCTLPVADVPSLDTSVLPYLQNLVRGKRSAGNDDDDDAMSAITASSSTTKTQYIIIRQTVATTPCCCTCQYSKRKWKVEIPHQHEESDEDQADLGYSTSRTIEKRTIIPAHADLPSLDRTESKIVKPDEFEGIPFYPISNDEEDILIRNISTMTGLQSTMLPTMASDTTVGRRQVSKEWSTNPSMEEDNHFTLFPNLANFDELSFDGSSNGDHATSDGRETLHPSCIVEL